MYINDDQMQYRLETRLGKTDSLTQWQRIHQMTIKIHPSLCLLYFAGNFFFAATLLSKTGEISIDILYNAVFMFFVPPGVALLLDNKRCILYFTLKKTC